MAANLLVSYGPTEAQVGHLSLPAGTGRVPVVCLLHGGFWRAPYGPEQMTRVAGSLQLHGFAVWNLGYRRVGDAGGGWPGTRDDVCAGMARLVRLAAENERLDLRRVAVVGHSAGGHLAFLAAAARESVVPAVVIGLAPVLDLEAARDKDLGRGAVAGLMGAEADSHAALAAASPRTMLPLQIPQVLIHGTEDEHVPIDLSRAYARAAAAAGDDIVLYELEGTGHMDFLDPAGGAHACLIDCLDRTLASPASAGTVSRAAMSR
jgi:acetyl esterase/lipase